MAAEVLASSGVLVDLYEQRRSPGRKFVLAGRSGLNLTNVVAHDEFVARIADPTGRVAAAVAAYDATGVRQWSAGLGEPTFVGSSGRVFPESVRATPLLRAWLGRLDELGVTFHTGHRWIGWSGDGGRLRFETPDGFVEAAPDATILALGGASWPRVGGDGSWVDALAAAGVDIEPLRAANAGLLVDWSAPLLSRFEGAPIKGLVARYGGVRARGDLTITRSGLEGTPVYSLAAQLGRDGQTDQTRHVHLDLVPDRELPNLIGHLGNSRRQKDSFATWMRRARVAPVVASLVREVTGNAPPDEAAPLASLLKSLPVPVAGVAPLDRAISTSGGVGLGEVGEGFGLMARPDTFVAGEMLDADVPTGGWLLQVAFSTGTAAAHGALAFLAR